MTGALDLLPALQRRRVEDPRREVAAGRVSELIGDGVSRRAGMPDGGQLARTLAEGRGLDSAVAGDLVAVCDALLPIDGPAWLHGELTRLLDVVNGAGFLEVPFLERQQTGPFAGPVRQRARQ